MGQCCLTPARHACRENDRAGGQIVECRQAGGRPAASNGRALLGSSVANLVIAIALTAIAPFARIARAPVLVLKERAFIEAGRALDFSHLRILLVHVLPNIVNDLLVMGTLWMATAVRTEASLSLGSVSSRRRRPGAA